MALTGLKIQKLLPKTNCKECGSNTCLAFAMKLAAKKIDLSACPYASDEAKAVLGAEAEPPVKGIALGPDKGLKLGEETVLYRHEKTFVNQTALAINVCDTDSEEHIAATLAAVRDYKLERVGEVLVVDMVAVTQEGASKEEFVKLAARAAKETGKPLVINSKDPDALVAAAEAVKGSRSLIACATPETAAQLVGAAKENDHALAITAPSLDELSALSAQIKKDGFNELVLCYETHCLSEQFQTNTVGRRAALKQNFKPLGRPSIHFVPDTDEMDVVSEASVEILKYGGIVVLPRFEPALVSVLMTLRMNIYTDPQKPIQVEPGLYRVGEPTEQSPVFVTTNFSLTYFIVSGEIENAGQNAWLVVPECEGMSVLTSWAAGKFSGDTIGKFCKEISLETKVNCRDIVIPGYISYESGDLEEAMPGWNVIVGPQEASDIESFIKARLS